MNENSEKEKGKNARAGFTLVELIVVIAILGILAGVAYPVYTGYITRANDARVLNTLSSILTAAESAAASAGDQITQIQMNTGEVGIAGDTDGKYRSIDFISVHNSLNRDRTKPQTEKFKSFLNELSELSGGHIIASDGYGTNTDSTKEWRAWINVSEDFTELSKANMKETSYGGGDGDKAEKNGTKEYKYLQWDRENGWYIADTNHKPVK